jgi:vacuolar-type H+-ATPase subunit H
MSADMLKRLDIQQSLNVLEELVLESPRVPFSRRTLVDEDQLLEQLDRLRLNLPAVFQEAIQIVQQRNYILSEANQYAQNVVNTAEQEASRRLDDLGIVQQAEAQARSVKQQLEQDCEALRSQTRDEVDQWQESAREYWENLKQQTEAECQAMRQEADAYAADVLHRIEQQLSDMMRVISNGRKSLSTHAMGAVPPVTQDGTPRPQPPLGRSNGVVVPTESPRRPRRSDG